MNTEYKVYFKIEDTTYLGARIRATHDKVELFYHYPWGSNEQTEIENLEDSCIENGYLPDHISFHTNGIIHSKARNGKKKKIYINKLDPEMNVFNLKKNTYLPFFIESINISNQQYINKRFKEEEINDPQKNILFDITGLNSFSLILVSKCERTNPKSVIENESFQKLNIRYGDIIMGAFSLTDKQKVFDNHTNFNTDLMILICENIFQPFNELEHHESGEIGMEFSTTICMPPIELIGKMVNLN